MQTSCFNFFSILIIDVIRLFIEHHLKIIETNFIWKQQVTDLEGLEFGNGLVKNYGWGWFGDDLSRIQSAGRQKRVDMRENGGRVCHLQ